MSVLQGVLTPVHCNKDHAFWICFAILLTLVCQTASAINFKRKSLPEWVEIPIEDTGSTLYGIGSGDTLAQAKQASLESIAGKLLTQVSSSASYTTQVRNDTANVSLDKQINSAILQTDLSGAQLDVSEKVKKTYWARSKIQRSQLQAATKRKLDTTFARLQQIAAELSASSLLSSDPLLKQLNQLLLTADNTLLVYNALSPQSYTGANELSAYRSLANQYDNKQLLITLPQKLNSFYGHFAEAFETKDWQLKKTGTALPQLNIKATFSQSTKFGNYFCKIEIQADVLEESGDLAASKEYLYSAASGSSAKFAEQAAINTAKEELAQQIIDDLF